MLRLQTVVHVEGVTGAEIFAFLADPDDRSYQEWWPGTHLQLHPVSRGTDHIVDVLVMDEYVGTRRLRMRAMVVDAQPGRRLVWAMRKVVNLPARLILDLADDAGGVTVTHTIEAGGRGVARLLDPLLRLYFSPRFAAAMDEHARTEFPMLGELLRRRR